MADEVRILALRAAEAALNTNSLIENTIKAVKRGNDLTQATREAFQENVSNAAKVGRLIDEIATASDEQAQGIDQINRAVAEMDKVTQQTASGAKESASASEELTGQAEQMKGYVVDLAAIIGNRQGGCNGGVLQGAPITREAGVNPVRRQTTSESPPAHRRRKPLPAAKKPPRPAQILPLEEGGFKDF